MKIKSVSAKPINDTRGEKTILVSIDTNVGKFKASSPTGKSTGKYESKSYKISLNEDVSKMKKNSGSFLKCELEKFEDLGVVEKIISKKIGANTLFAFESAILKAISKEQKKEVWQMINPNAKKFPRLVGNTVGGGKHSEGNGTSKKPDFQEFELIPLTNSPSKAYKTNLSAKKAVGVILPKIDLNFSGKKNDENAWTTTLNERKVLEMLSKMGIPLGLDIAASSFYYRKKYSYKNPKIVRSKEEQLNYVLNLVKNYNLFYIEDPFDEEDFESFAKLLSKCPKSLVVGDDLTVTNYKRLLKAIEKKSINAIIVKPNQNGSLLEVKRVIELSKQNKIITIFSHRSGETKETILADLAFGFGADFFKCGTEGDARIKKIERLIEIEKKLKKISEKL